MMTRKLWLICGILPSLPYVATDVMASWRYKGYSYTDQTYSELLATGVPTRSILSRKTVPLLLVRDNRRGHHVWRFDRLAGSRA